MSGEKHGETQAKGDEADEDEVRGYMYVITYMSGEKQQVWTEELPDELHQRYRSELGRSPSTPKVMRFPNDPKGEGKVMQREEALRFCATCKQEGLSHFCAPCAKPTEVKFRLDPQGLPVVDDDGDPIPEEIVDVVLPVSIVRVDQILHIDTVSEELEGDDDEGDENEDEGEDADDADDGEPEDVTPPAPPPLSKKKGSKLPAGFSL